jgi:hypothetical protein
VRRVSKHLHHFYEKREICQLTDYEYAMNIPTFCNYVVTVLLINC